MKTIISILTALAISAISLQAERVNVGGYFSIYVPDYWKVDLTNQNANNPGNYLVYKARTVDPNAPRIYFNMGVINIKDPTKINFEEWNRTTDADLPQIAKANQNEGFNVPTIRKTRVSGIPALISNEQNLKDKFNVLGITLFIRDRKFSMMFIYLKDGAKTVDKVLESLRIEEGGLIPPPESYTILENPTPTPSPVPASTPTPQADESSTTPNDCLVVATEIYGRLRLNAHWAKILTFQWKSPRNDTFTGHALTIYQPTETSNIFLYDKEIGGSKDLGTKSYDITEIVSALKSIMKDGMVIEKAHWVE